MGNTFSSKKVTKIDGNLLLGSYLGGSVGTYSLKSG